MEVHLSQRAFQPPPNPPSTPLWTSSFTKGELIPVNNYTAGGGLLLLPLLFGRGRLLFGRGRLLLGLGLF